MKSLFCQLRGLWWSVATFPDLTSGHIFVAGEARKERLPETGETVYRIYQTCETCGHKDSSGWADEQMWQQIKGGVKLVKGHKSINQEV